ncbi:MAG: hypothetical protein LBC51_07035 [Treponema sp.]|jgi:hypothetical protein|nr:hypothetical protein [Treponema sp.]
MAIGLPKPAGGEDYGQTEPPISEIKKLMGETGLVNSGPAGEVITVSSTLR